MTPFENTVKLRGFLGRDAEAPPSDGITCEAYVVLTVCIESGTWIKGSNKWIPQSASHRIICRGPFFCGFTRGMKQGDYIEIEGELRGAFIGEGTVLRNSVHAYLIHAKQIRRLEYPSVGVHEGEGG